MQSANICVTNTLTLWRWRGVDGGGGGGKVGVDAAARRCHEGRGIMTWGIAKRFFSGGILPSQQKVTY